MTYEEARSKLRSAEELTVNAIPPGNERIALGLMLEVLKALVGDEGYPHLLTLPETKAEIQK